MLEPNARNALHDVFRPPPDHTFDGGVLCTYSVSLRTLLSIPAALLVEAPDDFDRMLSPANAPKLLAAVRRTFGKLVVFCEESRIIASGDLSPIISDAEGVVRELRAPGGGAFHPKLWLLRFRSEEAKRPAKLRLAILSRNLTKDPSWDIGAVLDGEDISGPQPSEPISDFLCELPSLARQPLAPTRLRLIRELAEQAKSTKWRAPKGLSDPLVQIIGFGKGWQPPASKCLAVFSPFVDSGAIKKLRKSTKRGLLLVSRPDALDRCAIPAKSSFENLYVLARPVEQTNVSGNLEAGLHAKVYVWDQGRRTRIALGSANATSAALDGRNVEVVLDMDCTAAIKGGVKALIEVTQLSKVLTEYEPQQSTETQKVPGDTRRSRRLLIDAVSCLRCTASPEGYLVALQPSGRLDASVGSELMSLRFWPATCDAGLNAPCLDALLRGEPAPYPRRLGLDEITGFINFEARTKDDIETFALNLSVEGLKDADRRKAIALSILPTEESFLDFIRMLLGDSRSIDWISGAADGQSSGVTRGRSFGVPGILETLVRCAADDPERLKGVETAFDDLLSTKGVVPEAFRLLWAELHQATRSKERSRLPRSTK